MPFSHVLAGYEFTEANFAGTAYANEQTGFPKALEKIVEHVANAFRSPSTTSLAVGTGAKTLTVEPNRPFAVGQPVRIAATADPVNTFMDAIVTSYVQATGVMQVTVTGAKGTGTVASWMVSLGGTAQVVASPSPLAIADGGTGASTATTALANLGGLRAANNLSDVANVAAARTSLGLGAAAVDNIVPLARGGTGASDAATARTNLGLGTAAVESIVPLTKGGTGASSAAAARTSLGLGAVAVDNVVPLARGGTGGTDAATARTNLGLGTVAVESTLPVAKGGTGATTAAQARANLGITLGPTKPRSNRAQLTPAFNNTVGVDIIPTTSGSGYLNGIAINFPQVTTSTSVKVDVTVDGGAVQSFNVLKDDYLVMVSDTLGFAYTGFIPLNIRFSTSIKVRLERFTNNFSEGSVNSVISWALD